MVSTPSSLSIKGSNHGRIPERPVREPKPKEPRITPAEVGKAMAVSATDFQSSVENFARHGNVNEIDAWGLHVYSASPSE